MEKLSLRNAGRELPVALDRFACAGKSQCVGVKCVGVVEAAKKNVENRHNKPKIRIGRMVSWWIRFLTCRPSDLN